MIMLPKNQNIKAVIFDMDGLMFDTEILFSKVQSEIAEKRGKKFTLEIKRKMMGQKPLHAVEIMLNELGISENAMDIFKEQTEKYIKLLGTESQPMSGLFDILNILEKRNIRKCVATSSMREWADILLNRFNIKNRFEFIISGEDVKLGKPHPDIYLRAINDLSLAPDECLALEDAYNGVISAKTAGCFTVAVPNEFTKSQDFSIADAVVNSLSDEKLFRMF